MEIEELIVKKKRKQQQRANLVLFIKSIRLRFLAKYNTKKTKKQNKPKKFKVVTNILKAK